MATFSPYDAGNYERQKRNVEYDYGNQAATNANTVSGIIAPRVMRFGVNFRW